MQSLGSSALLLLLLPLYVRGTHRRRADARMSVHEEFVSEIESLDRWSMRLGKLQKRWDGKKEYFEQKRVDVLLSVDLVRHAAAGHIQHAVLIAGDSDFVPAVEAAKEHGSDLVSLVRYIQHSSQGLD